jgi:hypothetical protein
MCDVLPPHVAVLDHEVHHEITRMLLDVEVLEYEAEGAKSKFGSVALCPLTMEAHFCVELS